MKSCRDGFGEAMVKLGSSNRDVVALTADLSPSVRLDNFKKRFPSRFVDVGVAEQNLVGVASGMAHLGRIPFAAGFGAFMPGMCFQQIRTAVCYNNANVKLVASHCGVGVGGDGATHQMLEDIALMRSLPGLVVVAPCDYEQAKKMTVALSRIKGPCYMRFGRDEPVVVSKGLPFKVGKAQILKQGSDVAVVCCGGVAGSVLEAARFIEHELSVMVINMHTIKPLDEAAVVRAAKACGRIITVEDHSVFGGLGGAVSEVVSECCPVPVYRMGLKSFGESGGPAELLSRHGIDAKGVYKALKKFSR